MVASKRRMLPIGYRCAAVVTNGASLVREGHGHPPIPKKDKAKIVVWR
jgi:hypothetical protein